MMSSHVARPLTLIVAVPEEVRAKFTRDAVLEKLLASLKPDDVFCVQFVRVTFKSLEAGQAALCSGISIDAVRLTVFEADPTTVDIEHLPIEVPDDDLGEALSSFGTVHGIRLQRFDGPGICTGTRILKIIGSIGPTDSLIVLHFRVLLPRWARRLLLILC